MIDIQDYPSHGEKVDSDRESGDTLAELGMTEDSREKREDPSLRSG